MASTHSKDSLLWLVAIGFFMETLDSTIVNTALPTMARTMGTSPMSMQSVVIAYALTLAVFIPASGWLADRFGTRRIYFWAIVIFTLGSLGCALSSSLPLLILCRVIQGAGGSMLLPVGRLAVLRAFPGTQYIAALSFVAMPALIGPLIGPTLGGWIVEMSSWHWIFLINIPIGLTGCIATHLYMKDDPISRTRKFDLVGFLQIAMFMVCISLGLDGLSELHFSSGIVYLLLIFGFAALVSYLFHAPKVANPLFSLSVFKTKSYSIGIMGNLFARLGSSGMPFMIPLFLQLCLGHSPMEAGMDMLPLSIAGIMAKKIVSPLIIKSGYRKFLITNTFLVGIGMASFALITPEEPAWLRIIQLFFFGIVNSMQFTAMNTLTMKDLDRASSSDGNTLFSMIQMLALSFSVAAAGSLLSTFLAAFDRMKAFHVTFLCMGSVTCASALIFWQLAKDEKPKSAEPPITAA